MAKVGLENASLVKVIFRFQRTRMIASAFAGVLAMAATFVGPVIFLHFFLQQQHFFLLSPHVVNVLKNASKTCKIYLKYNKSCIKFLTSLLFIIFFDKVLVAKVQRQDHPLLTPTP